MRNNRRGVLELDHRLGRPVPADIDVAHGAVWLARRVCAVAVQVYPGLNRVEPLLDTADGRIIEPQGLRPLGADRVGVFELDKHAGRRKPSRVERRWVKRELASYEIDAAEYALRGRLGARDHDISHAPVVAADCLADDFKVKSRVVENDVLAAVCANIRKVVRERPHAIRALHRRAVRTRQRTGANNRACRAVGLGNAPVVHAILGKMHTVDQAGRRYDVAWLQIAAYRRLVVDKRANRKGAATDLVGLGGDDGERRIGAGPARGHRPYDDRLPGDVLDIAVGIGEPDADRRLRVVLERHAV